MKYLAFQHLFPKHCRFCLGIPEIKPEKREMKSEDYSCAPHPITQTHKHTHMHVTPWNYSYTLVLDAKGRELNPKGPQ